MRFKYFTSRTSGRSSMPKKDRCPKCGVKRSPGYNLCFTCGYRFFGEPQQKIRPRDNSHEKIFPPISELLQSKKPSELGRKCPQCGTNFSEGAKFCGICGKKFEEQQISLVHQEQKEERPIRNCPECGEEYLQGAKFCFMCGKKIEEKQIITSIEEKEEKKPINSCPKCGEEMLTGAKFCFTCGIKVEEIGSEPLESVIRKEKPEIISPPEQDLIPAVSEIRKEDPEIISPSEPELITPVPDIKNEEQTVIRTENLTPIPPIAEIERRKPKLKPSFCNFCGIRIPKKTAFCLQCGMIIKNN